MHPIPHTSTVQRIEVHGFEHSEGVLPGAKERRLVHRMLYFWAAYRSKDRLPSIDDLDIAAMPVEWRQCFILAQPAPGGRYEFDHLGRAFQGDCGDAVLGGTSDILPGTLLDHAVRPAPMVAENKVPYIIGGGFRRSGRVVKFRAILLPFEGRSSSTIYLLGSANCRQDIQRRGSIIEPLTCYKFEQGVWVEARLPSDARAANDA